MIRRPKKCFDKGFEYGDSESGIRIELARNYGVLRTQVGQITYFDSTEFRGADPKWRSDSNSLQNLGSVSQNLGVEGISTPR